MQDSDPRTELQEQPLASEPVRPGDALLPGSADPIVVLLLWALRRSFLPLLLLGFAAAVATGGLDEETGASLTSPGELVRALLSPLAGVAAAILIRLAVGWLALAAAWPIAKWHRPGEGRSRSQRFRDLVDRWRLAQAYRSLRWTWGVREEAIARAGAWGRRLGLAVPLSNAATVLGVVAFVAAVAFRGSPG